jgi:hypothetical protein
MEKMKYLDEKLSLSDTFSGTLQKKNPQNDADANSQLHSEVCLIKSEILPVP